MINVHFKNIKLYFYIIINISFSLQKSNIFNISIEINKFQLDFFYVIDNEFKDPCKKWIPSIFNPILLSKKIDLPSRNLVIENYKLYNPVFYNYNFITISLYKDIKFLDYEMYLAKGFSEGEIEYCYFGLSNGLANYNLLNESEINLNYLKNNGIIDKKIFSFDKWEINEKDNFINSTFHYGIFNDIFTSKEGALGTCESNPKDLTWGCEFKEMVFNENILLKNDNGTFLKVYFASEIYDLIFPKSFKDKIINSSKEKCEYQERILNLVCKDIFKYNSYLPLTLSNDDMKITGEIDSINRFNIYDSSKKDNMRIIFKEIDYIILPLIVFKNFYIQFNAENNKISFYTDNTTILQVKKEVENDSSSSTFIVFIVIFIIILIIVVLGYGVYFLIKKKGSKVEKSINKFSKLEEEEEFHNMNENRVF